MSELLRSQPWLGTFVEIHIDADVGREALLLASEQGFECVRQIQRAMSFHEPHSELSHINREAASKPVRVSPVVREVLSLALELSAASNGLFDVSVAPQLVRRGLLPRHLGSLPKAGDWRDIDLRDDSVEFRTPLWIDLGGIAKGYAVDLAFDNIVAQLPTAKQVSVNAGGDLRMLNWQDETAQIRFQRLWSLRGYAHVPMKAEAMASSGANLPGGVKHLINPLQKHMRPRGKVVTVFADRCILADALTKVAYLADRPADLMQRFSASALSTNRSGRVRLVA